MSVLLSFPPPKTSQQKSQTGRLMVAVLEALSREKFCQSLAVAWNAPADEVADRANKTSAQIRAKLARRGRDQFIPMGLTGAPHHLLLQTESQAEIAWSISNRWSTGCADADMGAPAFVLLSPDNQIPPEFETVVPVAVVGRIGGNLVLALAERPRHRYLPVVDSATLDTSSAPAGSRAIARAVRNAGRSNSGRKPPDDVVLYVILERSADVSLLVGLLAGLQEFCRRGNGEPAALPVLDLWPTSSVPILPYRRSRSTDVVIMGAVADLRRSRPNLVTRRRTLQIVARGDEAAALLPPPQPREFVASMMGDVALSGPREDALLSGGRFRGFATAPGSGFQPFASALLSGAAGRYPEFAPTTAFSFESDESRGVRVVEHLARSEDSDRKVNDTRLVSDYSFVRERPLLVSTHALTVAGDLAFGSHELLHLALPVGRSAAFPARAEYPDGRVYQSILGAPGQRNELHGSRFQISFGGQTLAIAFLTRTCLPLVASVGLHRVPNTVLVIGGRFAVTSSRGAGAAVGFAMLWGTGAEGVEDIDRLLTGRVPAALQRELFNGPASG